MPTIDDILISALYNVIIVDGDRNVYQKNIILRLNDCASILLYDCVIFIWCASVIMLLTFFTDDDTTKKHHNVIMSSLSVNISSHKQP